MSNTLRDDPEEAEQIYKLLRKHFGPPVELELAKQSSPGNQPREKQKWDASQKMLEEERVSIEKTDSNDAGDAFSFWDSQGQSERQKMCNGDFGWQLLHRWKAEEKSICTGSKSGDDGGALQSAIYCHRIMQTRHTAKDNSCYAHNLVLNSAAVRHVGNVLRKGYLSGDCTPSLDYYAQEMFSPDLKQQMMSYVENRNAVKPRKILHGTNYLLTRDGEFNVFHSMGDFINMYQTLVMLQSEHNGTTFQDTRIVIVDDFSDGPFFGLWKFFAPLGIYRLKELVEEYDNEPLLMERVVFHQPSGQNFIWKDIWQPGPCHGSQILQSFSRFILHKMELTESRHAHNDKINILFSTRNHKPGVVIGRKIVNEDELIQAMKNELTTVTGRPLQGKLNITVVDFGSIPFREQVRLVHNSDIFVGMHGAGNTHVLWLPEEAVFVELFPQHWHQSSMRNLAKNMGKTYLAWQNTNPRNHINANLWTRVDVNEFKRLMEAAVQVALSFNNGKGLI